MGYRTPIPKDVEARVLTSSRRRCCLCYCLDGKDQECRGQIAHIDRNASNAAFENLAYLCLEHHDRYDSKTSQSKGFTPAELSEYTAKLYRTLESTVERPAEDYRLKVRATGVVDGARVGLSIRVENAGKRPLRLDGWRMWWVEDQMPRVSESILPVAPIVITEREERRFNIWLDLPDPTAITEIGILDSDHRLWPPEPGWAEQVASMVERVEATKHLLPAQKDLPEDTTGQAIVSVFEAIPSPESDFLCLSIRITNIGALPLPILGGRLEWEFVQPRGGGRAKQLGGGINAPSPIGDRELGTRETAEFRIDGPWASVLIEAASRDVDRKKLRFVVQTSKLGAWVCTEDGLPEAIEQVARSVMARCQANRR
jgi:hypothetical protein